MLCVAVFRYAGIERRVAGTDSRLQGLAFYSTNVETAHVVTGNEGLAFFKELAAKDNFVFDTTTDWDKLNDIDLKQYQVILWVNDFPHTEAQRAGFQKYMEHGGRLAGVAYRRLQRRVDQVAVVRGFPGWSSVLHEQLAGATREIDRR